jgi:hypothetical protein
MEGYAQASCLAAQQYNIVGEGSARREPSPITDTERAKGK